MLHLGQCWPPSRTGLRAVFADFFSLGGHHYLVIGDRLSGWVEVYSSSSGTTLAGATGLIRHLRTFFATFGVPEELSSDGGPEFSASSTQAFLKLWGVRHRLSSAYFPQSNGRAEVAVKTAKRLLRSNTGPTGSLDHDRFVRAILQLRNTPDPDCKLSPAQIIFGHPLRDTLSFVNRLEKYTNPYIQPTWRQAWSAKEEALRSRITRTTEALQAHSRPLRPLALGDTVFIQNQQGNHPTKWDRSGVIVESLGNDQYRVKVDGSGRLTLRNRRFLRAYSPVSTSISHHMAVSKIPCADVRGQQPPEPLSNLPLTDKMPAACPEGQKGIVPLFTCQDKLDTPSFGPSTSKEPVPDTTNVEEAEQPHVPTLAPLPQDLQAPAAADMPSAEGQAPSPLPSRPRRDRRPPKFYDASTGTWIYQ